ncbi:immunoglobulin-like domain-containing protein, partial [Listeria sp. ILCC792]|uniref:immunoglobulin-like domain-containing protein n=1 Tax=Listeria sp. ILCC792 TaxID=1918331 RepID=UPI0035147E93
YFAVSTDSYVQGTFTGSVKYVSLVVNGTEYVKTPVKDANTWSYYSRGKIAMGDMVSVKGYNVAGVVVDEKQVNVILNPPGDSTITANNFVLYQDKYVTGTYTGSVKYIALKVNGTVLSKIPVSGGTYSYYARPNITSEEDVVSIIAYNSASVQVAEAPVRVSDSETTSAITANNYSIGDSSVIGTYSGDVKYISATVNGTELSKIPVDGSGTYNYYIRRYITSDTDTIVMNAYNSRNEIAKTTTVRINPSGPSAITAQTYNLGESSVVGTYSGDVKYISATVNDTELSKIPVDGSGTYDYYIRRYVTSDTDRIVMNAYNSRNEIAKTTPVNIGQTGPSAITAQTYNLGDSSVVGTYSGNVKYISATVNDTELSRIPVDGSGTYDYYIRRYVTSDQDTIVMKGYTAGGDVVASNRVTIPPTAPATLTTDVFTIGTSSNVTGTSTNGVKYIALKVEGVVKSKIPVNADGSFTYYAKALLKTPGMQVSMIGYGGANNILVETPVTVR